VLNLKLGRRRRGGKKNSREQRWGREQGSSMKKPEIPRSALVRKKRKRRR